MYHNKFEKIEAYGIGYWDLNKIIQSEYNAPDFQTGLDCSNGTILQYYIDGTLSQDDELEILEFINTKFQEYGILKILLNDLCRQGKIYPGYYLIKISW